MATLLEPPRPQVVTAASPGRPLKATDPAGVFESESPVTVAVQVLIPPFQSMLGWVQLTPMLVGPVVAPDDVDVVIEDVDVVVDVVVVVVVPDVIWNVAVPCSEPRVAATSYDPTPSLGTVKLQTKTPVYGSVVCKVQVWTAGVEPPKVKAVTLAFSEKSVPVTDTEVPAGPSEGVSFRQYCVQVPPPPGGGWTAWTIGGVATRNNPAAARANRTTISMAP